MLLNVIVRQYFPLLKFFIHFCIIAILAWEMFQPQDKKIQSFIGHILWEFTYQKPPQTPYITLIDNLNDAKSKSEVPFSLIYRVSSKLKLWHYLVWNKNLFCDDLFTLFNFYESMEWTPKIDDRVYFYLLWV